MAGVAFAQRLRYDPAIMCNAKTGPISITTRCKSLRTPRTRAAALVEYIARSGNRRIDMLDILVVDSAEMADMNLDYLNHTGPTDVISFDLADAHSEGITGQLILCGEVAREQAPRFGNRPQKELLLYLAHGLLHLMGYDDRTESGRAIMHQRQQELLEAFLTGDGK